MVSAAHSDIHRPRVLITGAARGLGLEFARQYAAEGWQVLATVRDPDGAVDLRAVRGKIDLARLDVADDDSLETFLRDVGATPLDLLIANAGIGTGGEKPASAVTREEWRDAMSVNAYAPFRLAAALRSNLERGEGRKFAAVSSLAASIATYPIIGHYAYRASKAALNSLWRSLAMEWRAVGLIGLLLRPGKVRTRMTGFTGDLDPVDAVRGMRAVIARAGLDDAGRFLGYDGREVPW